MAVSKELNDKLMKRREAMLAKGNDVPDTMPRAGTVIDPEKPIEKAEQPKKALAIDETGTNVVKGSASHAEQVVDNKK